MNWRVLPYREYSGAQNMAIDDLFFNSMSSMAQPVVRIYGWKPACISLGYFQKMSNELNLAKVKSSGIDVVQRMTGGRAVFHVNELTYSVIAPIDLLPWCRTQQKSYQIISEALLQALSIEGLQLSFARSYPREKYVADRSLSPCFSSSARFEVMYNNKKVVGSAQKRNQYAFLQHGSILCCNEYLDIVNYQKGVGDTQGKINALQAKSISLETILGRKINITELANDFLVKFLKGLQVSGKEIPLNELESVRVQEKVLQYNTIIE